MRVPYAALMGFLFLLACSAQAAGATLEKVVFWPDEDAYVPGQILYLMLDVTNNEGASVRNVPVDVSVDGRGVYSGVVNLNGSATETVRVSSKDFDSDWDPYECGGKEVRVRLADSYREAEFSVSGKKFSDVSVSPERITPGNYTEIRVLDARGEGHPAAKIKVSGSSEDYEAHSNGVGIARFMLAEEFRQPFGRFEADVWALGYCRKTIFFDVIEEHSLRVSVEPGSPKPFEEFIVQVVDEKAAPIPGAVVRIAGNISSPLGFVSDGAGVVRATVNNSGEYSVSVSKPDYANYSRSFMVSAIPVLEVKLAGQDAVAGKEYSILVSSQGAVLDEVYVEVKSFNESYAFSNGSIVFTPAYPGAYVVDASKDGYVSAKASFRAFNTFHVELVQVSWELKEILVKVLDQLSAPVSYVKVSVQGTTTSGLTDTEGFLKLNIPVRDSLTFTAEKDGFKDYEFTVRPNKTLYMDHSPAEVQLGDKIVISVRNDFGDNVIAELTITHPDGAREKIVKDKHTFQPDAPGDYFISAAADGYAQATLTINVKPRELSLSVNESGGEIFVRAESGRLPVGGLYVWFDTPTGRDYVITNSMGSAVYNAGDKGVYVAYVNDTPYMYTRKSVYVKGRQFPAKTLAAAAIGLCLLAVAAYGIMSAGKISAKKKKPRKPSLANL
ncbi:carboxypeptidase-like regulatory domain-containing protein [Patescibacteria group bacterium]|nr:carboxypeptidase-like regulatory domain-containing protein [Patescibacteria group bacterium]